MVIRKVHSVSFCIVSVGLYMEFDATYYGQGCQNLSYSGVFDDITPVVRKQ